MYTVPGITTEVDLTLQEVGYAFQIQFRKKMMDRTSTGQAQISSSPGLIVPHEPNKYGLPGEEY